MATELDQSEDAIIAAAKAQFPDMKNVDSWPEGLDIDALLDQVLDAPALFVILSSWDPGEKKTIGGGASSEQKMSFRLTVIVQNAGEAKDGSREAYYYVNAVMLLFKNWRFPAPLRGYLWPSAPAELIRIKNGYYAYGLEFERRYNG